MEFLSQKTFLRRGYTITSPICSIKWFQWMNQPFTKFKSLKSIASFHRNKFDDLKLFQELDELYVKLTETKLGNRRIENNKEISCDILIHSLCLRGFGTMKWRRTGSDIHAKSFLFVRWKSHRGTKWIDSQRRLNSVAVAISIATM